MEIIHMGPEDLLDFDDYQSAAATYVRGGVKDNPALYALHALAEEIGEVHAIYAKALRKEVDIDLEDLASELGDVLWNLSLLAETYGLSLAEIAADNLKKLEGRNQDGTIIER